MMAAAPLWAAAAQSGTTIVVRILEGRVTDRVTIGAPALLRVSFSGGALTESRVTIATDGSSALSLRVGEKSVRAVPPLTIAPASGAGILTVSTAAGEHRYRGTLTVYVRDSAILLLNNVPIEDYLLSVVPAELTTKETEALMAQAILCRTFALKNRGRHGDSPVLFAQLRHLPQLNQAHPCFRSHLSKPPVF